MPSGKQSRANQTIEAEKAADMAVFDDQLRNIRSTNVITVHETVETTKGSATCRTSRPPAGRRHQEAISFAVEGGSEATCVGSKGLRTDR